MPARRQPTVVDAPAQEQARPNEAPPPFFEGPRPGAQQPSQQPAAPRRQPTVDDIPAQPQNPSPYAAPQPAFYQRPAPAPPPQPAVVASVTPRAKTVLVGSHSPAPRRLRAVLVEYRSPEDPGRVHFLRDGRNAIGRDEECEVRSDDASVSKTHAFIYVDPDGMRLVDNSQNGTVVDGRTVRGAQVSLTAGSKLDLGGARYVFVPIPPPFEQ